MIKLEEAKIIAKKVIPKIDAYHEYPDAFWFRISNPSKDEIWDNAVIVKKRDGSVLTAVEYIINSKYADKKVPMKKL